MKSIICWQKWIDPYGSNLDEFDEEFRIQQEKPQQVMANNQFDDQPEEEPEPSQQIKKGMKLLFTPMGVIPLTEQTIPSKIFNFWVGHTNFNITNKIAKTISETNGVETFDIYSRYRFRIGIGHAFDSTQVRQNINLQLNKVINDRPGKTNI